MMSNLHNIPYETEDEKTESEFLRMEFLEMKRIQQEEELNA